MPHFFGNILGKNKIILENGWSNSAFFRPHLKNCYCDKRYLGKWVGDPLKIVQNESVTKKIPTTVHFGFVAHYEIHI